MAAVVIAAGCVGCGLVRSFAPPVEVEIIRVNAKHPHTQHTPFSTKQKER